MSTKPNTSQITYDTGSNKQDLNSILDTVVPIADYAALRNYTGRATQVRITADDISGFFKYDSTDTTSTDNGGTIIVAGTKRWKRVPDFYLPAGTGAVTTTVEQALSESVSVFRFMTKEQIDDVRSGSASIDVTGPIKAAIAHCKTLPVASLWLPAGDYFATDTLEFDLPNQSTLRFDGRIKSNVSAKVAVRIGSSAANRCGYFVTGIDVRRTSNDPSSGSVGVEIRNLTASEVHHKWTTGFTDGVLVNGDQPNGGVSYMKVFLGYIVDNKKNVRLTASGSGYCNENSFFGGRFGYHGSYAEPDGTCNLTVDYYAGNQLNNNRFYSPSFEGHSPLTKAAFIDGSYTFIVHPRLENSGDYPGFLIHFGPNSEFCELIGKGFGVSRTNILDAGVSNSYETKQGVVVSAEVDSAKDRAVLTLKSNADGAAQLIRGLHLNGTQAWAINADGSAFFNRTVYVEFGLRWQSSDGTGTDRGIFIGSGSPEGVTTARPGSLFKDTETANLYTKTWGSGSTGWVLMHVQWSGSTPSRPASPSVGTMYFDTTLGKPVWWKGSGWVDSAGAAV